MSFFSGFPPDLLLRFLSGFVVVPPICCFFLIVFVSLSERLVVGCGFCTFGDPLNLQLVRIVQSRTHSKPFMSHSHASASCTPLSSVHFTTAPTETI